MVISFGVEEFELQEESANKTIESAAVDVVRFFIKKLLASKVSFENGFYCGPKNN
jgi:hypothetical protein